MYQRDPKKRASLNDISAHPWLKGELPTEIEIEKECFRVNQLQKKKLL
jgi:hypothetical protein